MRVGEDDRELEVFREGEIAVGKADVLEPEAAARGGEEEKLAEAENGGRKCGNESGGLGSELGDGAGSEARPEDALDGVLEDMEDVGVAEEEGAGFVGGEGGVAAGKGVKAGDGEGVGGVGEDELLELESAADLLLDLHVVVKGVIADALELLRN